LVGVFLLAFLLLKSKSHVLFDTILTSFSYFINTSPTKQSSSNGPQITLPGQPIFRALLELFVCLIGFAGKLQFAVCCLQVLLDLLQLLLQVGYFGL